MFEGVKVVSLRQSADDRDKITHMIKATDPVFIRFVEDKLLS